ncbi:MAG: DUF5659 domain-containing protein [Fusobacterium sp.]
MKIKKIFSLKLANELMRKGFDIVGYEINLKNPILKVFHFEATKELSEAMTEITK